MTWPGLTPPYGALIVDAPWRYHQTQRHRADAARQYSTMSLNELQALPVGELAADDAHLWLWVTARGMAEGWHVPVIKAWGFRPQGAVVTWCKTGQPGVGAVVRCNTEFLVLGVKGTPPVPDEPLMTSWVASKREYATRCAHSKKPGWAMDMIRQVSPGPYVELFARQPQLGIDSWGLGYEGQVSA